MKDMELAQKWIDDLRAWLKTFEKMPDSFYVDYTPGIFPAAGLNSNGFSFQNDTTDAMGNIFVAEQINFALFVVFPKPPDVDELSTQNAVWLLAFQHWVMRQSLLGKAPKFGNEETDLERIRALNGMYLQDPEDGTGQYVITLSVQFKETIQEDE